MELLGLMVQNTLRFDKHVDIITLVKNNHDERKLDTGVGEGRIQGPSFFIGTFILVVAARTNNSLQKFWVNDEALTDEYADDCTSIVCEKTRKDCQSANSIFPTLEDPGKRKRKFWGPRLSGELSYIKRHDIISTQANLFFYGP